MSLDPEQEEPEDALADFLSQYRTTPRDTSVKMSSKGEVQPSRSDTQDPTMMVMEMLKQQAAINNAMLNRLEAPAPAPTQKTNKRTRGVNDDDDEATDLQNPEERTVSEVVHVLDNSMDKLCLSLRAKFRSPNCDPASWWRADTFDSRVARPRRGASLYLDHLAGSQRMHPETVLR